MCGRMCAAATVKQTDADAADCLRSCTMGTDVRLRSVGMCVNARIHHSIAEFGFAFVSVFFVPSRFLAYHTFRSAACIDDSKNNK